MSGQTGLKGNFAVGPQGSLTLSGPSAVSGSVTLNGDATLTTNGPAHVGSVTHADLSGAVNDALSASTGFAALTATQTLGNVLASTTVTGNGGVNVVAVASLNLSGSAALTLAGTTNDLFILSVSGVFAVSG